MKVETALTAGSTRVVLLIHSALLPNRRSRPAFARPPFGLVAEPLDEVVFSSQSERITCDAPLTSEPACSVSRYRAAVMS
jgi:hypothetical protein